MIELRASVPSITKFNLLTFSSFTLYLISLATICFSYQSIEPFLIINFFLSLFLGLVFLLCGRRHFDDFISTFFIFSICLFWSAIASIYLNVFDDSQYTGGDSGFFLELAKGGYFVNPIFLGSNFYDGIGAVSVWKIFYDIFAIAGFAKLPYIGVTINIILVSLSGLFSLKMVKMIYPNDQSRYYRFIFLYCSCGLLMLFASLHLRDAFVLLVVTFLSFGWVNFIKHKTFIDFLALSLITAISSFAFLYLRAEFVALSLGFALSFSVAYLLTKNLSRLNKNVLVLLFCLLGIMLLTLVSNLTSSFSDLFEASIAYSQAAEKSGSLGYEFIISQPLPIRLILGSIILFIMPIPFWSGIELNSIYYLFKSLSAFYFYFFIPLMFLSLLNFLDSFSA